MVIFTYNFQKLLSVFFFKICVISIELNPYLDLLFRVTLCFDIVYKYLSLHCVTRVRETALQCWHLSDRLLDWLLQTMRWSLIGYIAQRLHQMLWPNSRQTSLRFQWSALASLSGSLKESADSSQWESNQIMHFLSRKRPLSSWNTILDYF